MHDDGSIDADRLLDGLELEWQVGLDTIARWDTLSDEEQLAFVLEWAIPRGYYQELDERFRHGDLTTEECRRFDTLRRWIEEHRAALEAILEEPAI
jgi:hypothetical protein